MFIGSSTKNTNDLDGGDEIMLKQSKCLKYHLKRFLALQFNKYRLGLKVADRLNTMQSKSQDSKSLSEDSI